MDYKMNGVYCGKETEAPLPLTPYTVNPVMPLTERFVNALFILWTQIICKHFKNLLATSENSVAQICREFCCNSKPKNVGVAELRRGFLAKKCGKRRGKGA